MVSVIDDMEVQEFALSPPDKSIEMRRSELPARLSQRDLLGLSAD